MSTNNAKQTNPPMRPRRAMGGPHGAGGGEKADNFKGTWIKLLSYCKIYLKFIIIAVVCSALGSVFTIIGPDKLSELTNIVVAGMMSGVDLDAVFNIGIELAVLYGLGMLMTLTTGLIMAQITQGVTKNLRGDISAKINLLPMSYFDTMSIGDILSRVTNDVDTIAMSFNQSIGTLVSSVTLLLGSLVMMLKTNLILTLVSVIASLIGFVFMGFISSKSQKYFNRQQNSLGAVNGHIEEIYSGQSIVKAYNAERYNKTIFTRLNKELRDNNFKSQCLSGLMMPIMVFVGNLGYVAVCVAGSMLAAQGTISFGVIVAFIMYVRLFTQPLSQIAQGVQSLQSAAAAAERVFEFLEAQEMEDESYKTKEIGYVKGNIDFENVRFGYNKDKIIIKDFSAKTLYGQKVAIVGPTGAGKTTMVNLLMRFYELDGGHIKIDGIPTTDFKREDIRSKICMVLQDTWLFEGTIRENLVYCNENASDEKVDNACKAVGLDYLIKILPNGYDTVLSDSSSLSAGQKQQITIARAMIANKPIIILDEATSSVDTRTELQIQDAMDKLMAGRLSFIIAHRLSTIKNADLILVMKDGDVVESGNHKELLAKNGFYADLYNSQFDSSSSPSLS